MVNILDANKQITKIVYKIFNTFNANQQIRNV